VTVIADTNAVLAFLLDDRPTERRIVADWVAHHGPLLVTEAVFIETCWVLGGGPPASRAALVDHVRRLFASADFTAWDEELVQMTLTLMGRHPPLAAVDCLLAARASRGDLVVTFDRRLDRVLRED
jgi:predicted nucleic acid-binding protein